MTDRRARPAFRDGLDFPTLISKGPVRWFTSKGNPPLNPTPEQLSTMDKAKGELYRGMGQKCAHLNVENGECLACGAWG